ncbi:hypothetical protein IE81DRAFT_321278 [Ceraceosorus guamensis]|uniref:Uncharacterized protein n=1 Tax=Ceraceosorus guamensis TaxID=1522189 RepID=A0A316W3B5_9BASI|nr:hypothetical protein IE81DRAFT_321278 [Ceraceosorus guamensis]PWN44387.1 hypothetical protein IE81DRAFT_321278 [Ceraceosorus guamensis]
MQPVKSLSREAACEAVRVLCVGALLAESPSTAPLFHADSPPSSANARIAARQVRCQQAHGGCRRCCCLSGIQIQGGSSHYCL